MKKLKNYILNIIDAKIKILIIATSVVLFYLLASTIFSVYITDKTNTGFSYLEKGGEVVNYYCSRSVINISIFPKEVTVTAFSYRDADSMLIAHPDLTIISLEVFNSLEDWKEEIGILCEESSFTVPPLSKVIICIRCEGEYGGVGNGDRHGPELKIVNERISIFNRGKD